MLRGGVIHHVMFKRCFTGLVGILLYFGVNVLYLFFQHHVIIFLGFYFILLLLFVLDYFVSGSVRTARGRRYFSHSVCCSCFSAYYISFRFCDLKKGRGLEFLCDFYFSCKLVYCVMIVMSFGVMYCILLYCICVTVSQECGVMYGVYDVY